VGVPPRSPCPGGRAGRASLDAVCVLEAGFPAVAVLGTDVTEPQAAKIAALGKVVRVAFDPDDAGRRAQRPVLSRLGRKGVMAQVYPLTGADKDVGDRTADEVRRWLTAHPSWAR
jgi:DNA primase